MGRPKSRKKKTRPKISKSENDIATRRAVKKTKRKYGVEQLLDKVDECMDQLDLDGAKMFCERALQINPDHPRALEVTGNLLLEANEPEKAKQCFGRAITLQPDKSPSIYLNLAQLSEGQDAVQLFEKGIELLLKQQDENAEENQHATKISSAYCSIAEVFMTDLCFEDGAEASCKTAIENAIRLDPSNFEAYQVYASFLLSVNKMEESKKMLKKSLSFWFKRAYGNDEETAESEDTETPPFPLRMASAKLLIEHNDYKMALQVLEQLLEEDDEEIELWYLSGTCYYSLHQRLNENGKKSEIGTAQPSAESYNDNRALAVENFAKALETMVKLGVDAEEMVSDITTMVKDLGYSGNEPQFDLKHIRSTLKVKSSEQMTSMLGAVAGAPQDDMSDNESLTLSDKEFLNEYGDSGDESDDDGTRPSTSSNGAASHEPMEEC